MLESFYTIANWILIGVTCIFGIYLLALPVPQKASLHNYSIARIVMACAYLSFGIISIIEYFTQSDIIDFQLFRFIALLIALCQAFLFTYTLITLINTHFATKKKITLEILPILLFLVLGILELAVLPGRPYFDFIIYSFIVYYISSLIRYTYIFMRNYRKTMIRLDNIYAEDTNRFRWILISFIAALCLGILALLLAMFYTFTRGVIFTVLSICFYLAFGIRFINYAFLFQKFELLIEDENDECAASANSPYYSKLEDNILKWIENKQFLQHEINIQRVAGQLKTNRTYLSEYINTVEKKTFKAWINNLRIEEAKKLLLKHPETPVHEICDMVGFSDKSNFGKQFTLYTGKPPAIWRKSNINI